MTTSFSTLPLISLAALSSPSPSPSDLQTLASQLDAVFSTTGFAYLTDLPLTCTHKDVFGLCEEFFSLEMEQKMSVAKKTFVASNNNTYRGYFPPQASATNLKEGFELGPSHTQAPASGPSTLNRSSKFNLSEPNVFPSSPPGFKNRCEALHSELQSLSAKLLSLVAIALGKPASFFDHYLTDSLSTLRLLHYPPSLKEGEIEGKVVCEPHTDSGILTLLHQDETGGLEVRNGKGEWVPAPYVQGSVVVNIGDLMERVSGGRWVATMHRVRESGRGERKGRSGEKKGRYSVPFFFEPGEKCLVRGVEGGEAIVYGEHVLAKMSGWLEFQDLEDADGGMKVEEGNMVAVY